MKDVSLCSMSKLEFFKWIDLKHSYGTLAVEPYMLPNLTQFSTIDWIKTFLYQPCWMFSTEAKTLPFLNNNFKIKIIKHHIKKGGCRLPINNTTKSGTIHEFNLFCENHIPEWYILRL